MKKKSSKILIYLLFLILLIAPGCSLVEVVFEAGLWTGIFLVLAIIAVIAFIIIKISKKKK